jgi:hypothetical protein
MSNSCAGCWKVNAKACAARRKAAQKVVRNQAGHARFKDKLGGLIDLPFHDFWFAAMRGRHPAESLNF